MRASSQRPGLEHPDFRIFQPRQEELLTLYRDFGGLQDAPSFRPGPWDLAFEGGLVVELDEELHFNQYRGATLETSWADELPWTDARQEACD